MSGRSLLKVSDSMVEDEARPYPCFTSFVILNGLDASPLETTSPVMSCHHGAGRLRSQTSLGTLTLKDHLKFFSVHCIICFGQIYEDSIQIHLFLSAFLLDLLDSEDHVDCAAIRMESPLGFLQVFFSDVDDQAVEDDSNQNASCHLPEGYAQVISTVTFAAFIIFLSSKTIATSLKSLACLLFISCW